ncbi:MAG: hypothetical protein AAFR54_11050 [Planctomycetota bacterium]
MTDAPTRTERRRSLLRLRRGMRILELRERIMEICYGCLAAALALASPARVPYAWGGEAAARLAGDDERMTQGLLFPVASGFQSLFDVANGTEVVRLLAAIALGGAVIATLVCLRRLGFRRSASLPATFAAYGSVFAWRGSTSPVDYAFGLLGSALLLQTLCTQEQTTRRGYHWRAVLFAGLAYMLHPETVLLVPAVAIAVARHPAYRDEQAVNLMAVLVVLGMSIAIGLSGSNEFAQAGHLAERALGGADGFSPAALVRWIPALLLGFGAVLLGVYALVLDTRAGDSKRAPLWIVPWCFAAIAPLIAGTPTATPIAPYLVPAGALGLADWLNRRGSRARERTAGTAVLLAQLALLALALSRPLPA